MGLIWLGMVEGDKLPSVTSGSVSLEYLDDGLGHIERMYSMTVNR